MNNEERLLKVFANVNDWLKFAEAKNAMILAFNAASIYGITKMYDLDLVEKSECIQVYLLWVIIQLVFSCACSLISFVPRVKIIKEGYYASGDIKNTLFFEYLKTKSNLEIIKEVNDLQDELNAIDKSSTNFEKDIAEQIKQNSLIASRKYSHFCVSVWITIAAYVTIPLAVIFAIYNFKKA